MDDIDLFPAAMAENPADTDALLGEAHRVITSRGAKPCRLLWGLRRRGGNISVDLSLFAKLYNTNFKNKLKLNYFLKN